MAIKTQTFILLFHLGCFFTASTVWSRQIVDDWKFTLKQPVDGWNQTDFDAGNWEVGTGGFGSRNTPGAARIGTAWTSKNIWLRKTFEIANAPSKPALLVHHDEDAVIFLNGELLAELKGFSSNYHVVPVPGQQKTAIKTGKNLLAVHCKQTSGGQFIDVHLIDSNDIPTLPRPIGDKQPFQSELITEWGEAVTPENAWTEYPRPMLRRDNWTNLNGQWDYAVTSKKRSAVPEKWDGKLLVPFCLESKLGGVNQLLEPNETLWYKRTFGAKINQGKRILLNFEAVDYRCEAFVNGQPVGQHVGGNCPFSFDVTDALTDGENELIVRVEDETESFQLRGKQTLNARGIWYTQVSGIWQTVWLEEVSQNYIKNVKIQTDVNSGSINFTPLVNGSGHYRFTIRDGEQDVGHGSGTGTTEFRLNQPRLWSPSDPHLYDLEIELIDDSRNVLDKVTSYAGLRSVGKMKDADGHWRFTLNGEPIFHWGPLDQGWWPDGLLTPPSDEAMLFDIEWLKSAGFNMIRKHIKVEPRRYYYHCDRLGMLVWQDQVSGGQKNKNHWPAWTRLKPKPKDATWPDHQHQQFMRELEEMIDSLENHPSIVCWVPFNEAWGQHRTIETGKWMAKRDPSRMVNIASGGNFWPVGDIVDAHKYPHPEFPFDQDEGGRFDEYIKVIGEFGGHGYPVKGHLWDSNRRNWGYGGLPEDKAEYKERYTTSIKMLCQLQQQGIAGGVYTQTTDVEGEINGLMTYDRKAIKISARQLAELHQVLFQDFNAKAAKLR